MQIIEESVIQGLLGHTKVLYFVESLHSGKCKSWKIYEIKLNRNRHNTVGTSHSLSNRSHGLRQSLVFPNTTGARKSTFLRMDHRVGGGGGGGSPPMENIARSSQC